MLLTPVGMSSSVQELANTTLRDSRYGCIVSKKYVIIAIPEHF